MNWREAFRRQAKSDFAVFERLNNVADVEFAHRLHYLQMAAEKLAKSFMEQQPPPATHAVIVKMLRVSKQMPAIRKLVGYAGARRYGAYVDGLMDVAHRLERLVPALAGVGPNTEYPWRDAGAGAVVAPCDFDAFFSATSAPKLNALVRLIRQLLGAP